uniref:Putative STRUBBELIG-receptor family 2 n=1 Tax=Helianthus annuus TaxID=4232 RepID=A0A251UMW3_HELAN
MSAVKALQDLYSSFNSPPQLKGWKSSGGDPCQESWTGVTCSGSSIIQMDVSNNNIYGEIPYSLPSNLTHLNLSHNFLSGPIGNVFTGLSLLEEMDLSYNQFIGDLPSSFGTLRGLSKLSVFLQHNEFTGSVIYLAGLQLTDLFGGNMFGKGENGPPWDFPLDSPLDQQNITFPPSTESNAVETYPLPESMMHKGKKMSKIGVLVGGGTLVVACLLLFVFRFYKCGRKLRRHESSIGSRHSLPLNTDCPFDVPEENLEISVASSPSGLRHFRPAHTKFVRVNRRRSFAKKTRTPIGAKLYTVAELELATNSFNRTNFLGEGSLGTVFRGDFPDGQVFTVKCISTVALSLLEEQQFLEVIWNASHLRHPNIITLHGYCVEQGQHMLVYEYVRNLSLDHALHSEAYMPLSWGMRLKIALGIARALNYLHSICVPPLAHRNLKSANVLLDEDLIPRVSDCCLAILKPLTINSAKAEGSETVASEDIQPVSSYQKDDIYAFGVLLLELLTGKKAFDSGKEESSLVQWASSRLHDSESLDEMVEPALRKTIPQKLCHGLLISSPCVLRLRPSISEIMESVTSMIEEYRKMRSADIDPYERSFRSTQSRTRFLGSPSATNMSY